MSKFALRSRWCLRKICICKWMSECFLSIYRIFNSLAWAMFIEIVLNRSITQPLASSREFSWRCSLSTLVVDSHRCCWLITFSSRPRVRNCLHFINLLNCQEDPNKPKLWVALWINCNRDSLFWRSRRIYL